MKAKNYLLLLAVVYLTSCNSEPKTSEPQKADTGHIQQPAPDHPVAQSTVSDSAAIATLDADDFILKVHKAVTFQLKPKAYEPLKVDPATKLVVLDVSVRNKLATPLDLSKILGMTVLKGKGDKNLVAPWVVAAYITDYPYPNHQKEYDALWSTKFEGNGFHRAMLIGLNPGKQEKDFTLSVPTKADYNNPSKRDIRFSIE